MAESESKPVAVVVLKSKRKGNAHYSSPVRLRIPCPVLFRSGRKWHVKHLMLSGAKTLGEASLAW